MNTFATIKLARAFKKVTYYTVLLEDHEHSEFEKFILKHASDSTIHNEYNDLMALLQRIGDEIGALPRYFTRNERNAEALPPEWDQLLPNERRLHVKYHHNLRLYCMRISNEVVFLFNGGVKTPGPITAEECAVVRKYFRMANTLAIRISEAQREGQLKFEGTKITIEKDFELIL